MVNEDRWREMESREQRSARMRQKFGLDDKGSAQRDWLLGPGAIPVTLIVVALVVYVIIALVS